MTLRGLRILRDEVAAIACEDTRQTQKLLQHFQIRKPLLSCHEHNEAARSEQILLMLQRGESVALVSDAGTPLVSDPGYRVVRATLEANLKVVPIPGPSACITALVASGFAAERFRFMGFLPAKSQARRTVLTSLREDAMVLVAYESPHRILDCLRDIAEIMPTRSLVVARELTKIHEEFLRGNAEAVLEMLSARPSIKGEFTVVFGEAGMGPSNAAGDPKDLVERLEASGVPRMEAIKTAARQLGLPKRELYRLVAEDGVEAPDNT